MTKQTKWSRDKFTTRSNILDGVFRKNSQPLKAVNHFRIKHSILDVRQDSENASVICYSFFGKTKNANKIYSVAMKIYLF